MADSTLINRRRILELINEANNKNTIGALARIDEAILDHELGMEQAQASEDAEYRRVSPIFNLPSKKDTPWGSRLEMSPTEYKAYKRASSEVMTREAKLMEMQERSPELGLTTEYQDFVELEGRTGFLDRVDRNMTTPLTGMWEALEASSFAMGAGLEATLDTGNIWKGWSAAINEVGYGYVPGYKGISRKTDFIGLGEKYGLLNVKSDWMDPTGDVALMQELTHWGGLLMATMIVDPINLFPPAGLLSASRKVGRALTHVPGFPSVKKAARTVFKVNPELPEKYREPLVLLKRRYGAKAQNEMIAKIDEIEKMLANMKPVEKRVLGILMDQPEFMEEQIKALSKAGHIDPNRVDELIDKADIIKVFTRRLFDAEKAAPMGGLVSEEIFKDVYLHGTEAKDPDLVLAYQKNSALNRPTYKSAEGSFLPGLASDFPAAQGKTFKTNLDRALASIEGTARTTELDIVNILKARSIQSVRFVVSRQFAEAVLTNPELSQKLNLPTFFLQGKGKLDGMNLDKWLAEYENKSGRAVKLIKRKVIGPGDEAGEEIIGAWGLPREVKMFLDSSEELITNKGGALEKFLEAYDNITNIWKGWATFGTGYHARNTISILNSNWMAGVGRDVNGVFSMQDFMLRNLQAIKLMSIANGAGRLPNKMRKVANRVAKKYGWNSLDEIPDLNIVGPDGKKLSYKEIAALGEGQGVPQVASALYNTDEAINHSFWDGAVDKLVPIGEEAIKEGVRPDVAKVLSFGTDVKKSIGDVLTDVAGKVGGDNIFLRGNRAAAQIIENQGRWTLFLDSLSKGMPTEVAAEMPRLWHFDYRMLSEVEKGVFRRIIPFYAWQRFAAPRMIMAALEDPAHVAKMPKLKNSLEQLAPEFQEADTPDYWEEVQMWQVPYMNQDNMPVGIGLDIAPLEINKGNSKDMLSGVNPLLTAPIEAAFNFNIFMDKPIEKFEGQWATRYEGEEGLVAKEGVTPWTRKEEFMWSKLFPPMGKYIRFQKAQERGEGQAQLLSEFLGIKAKILDERRLMRGRVFQKMKYGREFWKVLEQRALEDPEFGKLFPELRDYQPKLKDLPALYYNFLGE